MMSSKTPSSSRRPKSAMPPNTDVGSFVFEEVIGKGSFATVYKGTHKVRGQELDIAPSFWCFRLVMML